MKKNSLSKSKAVGHSSEQQQVWADLTLDFVNDFVSCDLVEPSVSGGSAENVRDSSDVDVSKYLSVKDRVHMFPGQAKAAIGALPFLREDILGLRQELRALVEGALGTRTPDETASETDSTVPGDPSEKLPQHHAEGADAADWPVIPKKSPTASLRLLAEALQFSQTKDDIIETIFESPIVVYELSRGNDTIGNEERGGANVGKRATSDDQAGQGEVNRFARQAVASAGHSGEATSTALLRQEAKDIQRDRITVNGTPISDGGRSYDAIVTDFQSILKALISDSVYGEALSSTAADNTLQSPNELDRLCRALAMVLLHAGNRTQSGGASFSEVMNLFSTPVSIIAPVSDRADPLCYDISIGPFGSPSIDSDQDADGTDTAVSSDLENLSQGAFSSTRWGLRCHVRANSYYKICDNNPADESTSTWAVIKAQYDSWLGHDLMLSAIARYADDCASAQPISLETTETPDTNNGRRKNAAAPTAGVLCQASAIERGVSHLSTVITMEVCFSCMSSLFFFFVACKARLGYVHCCLCGGRQSSVEATHSAEDQLFSTVYDVKEWLEVSFDWNLFQLVRQILSVL